MSSKDASDAALLAQVPDRTAVAVLYERHVAAVFRFAVRRSRDPEDVADLVATVFLELFTAAPSYDPRRGDARSWLLGIASRCLADQQRAGYRRAALTVLRGLAAAPAQLAVRAAVYRLLATTPGIQLVGRTVDAVGRPGTTLSARLGAFRFTLIIDPATGELLQTSRTLLYRSPQAAGWRPGMVNRATFLATGVVRSTRAGPADG